MTTEFVYVTYIRASAEKVFDALTDPEMTRAYWGHANTSGWREGARWDHNRLSDGLPDISGDVIENRRPERLVVSWSGPDRYDDKPSHSRVTYEIEPYEDMVRLTVTHDRLEPGSGMDRGIRKGWPLVLSSLKSYLETGKALDVNADH